MELRDADPSPGPPADFMTAPRRRPLGNTRHAVRRRLRWAKYFTGDRPWLLPLNLRLTPEGRSRAISAETDIVIEGFPRSGNTFAVFAFTDAQEGRVSVASHIHHLAPLKIASRRRLPLLVVCREPVACLSSYLVAGPHARPAGVIEEYIHHHTGVLALRQDMIVATFDQVTTDLGGVIERVNVRYGTDFNRFVHEPTAEARVFDAIAAYHAAVHRRKDPARVVPMPSEERHAEAVHHTQALTAPACADRLAEAQAIYDELEAVATA